MERKRRKNRFLVADATTKEVHANVCESCAVTAGSANVWQLRPTYDEVAKTGNILGVWHSHPVANSIIGIQPSSADFTEPSGAIPAFRLGAVGVIVMKNTISPYAIQPYADQYPRGTDTNDEIRIPGYGLNYSGNKGPFQLGTFDRKVNSKTYWNE